MYLSDFKNLEKWIVEFKNFINEIYKCGMGVILDVVYNYIVKVDIFEDLELNYYYFMDVDGIFCISFGGGCLGIIYYMIKWFLVDFIKYLVDIYKVDGFCFDMMGDYDAVFIEEVYKAVCVFNLYLIMFGEGWRIYVGDENMFIKAVD